MAGAPAFGTDKTNGPARESPMDAEIDEREELGLLGIEETNNLAFHTGISAS